MASAAVFLNINHILFALQSVALKMLSRDGHLFKMLHTELLVNFKLDNRKSVNN